MTVLKQRVTILLSIAFLSFGLIFCGKDTFAVDTGLNEQVESAEEIRNNEHRAYLGLDLPIETDNPNYQIEFTEPDDVDVEIKIDDGEFSVKKSPYTLPSLSIGRHVITFKFEDEDGVEQTLAEILIVLPRSPSFIEAEDLSFDSGDSVTFSGTALPNSTVVLLISSDLVMEIVTADGEGDWSVTVSEVLSEGSHQVVGFVRKDGYASDFSDAITFNIGADTSSELTVGEPDNPFGLDIDVDWGEIFSEDNKYYFIGSGGVVLLLLLVFVGSSFKSNAPSGKDIQKLNNGKKEDKGEKMTLRDKLGSGLGKKGSSPLESAPKLKKPDKKEELKKTIDKATKGKDKDPIPVKGGTDAPIQDMQTGEEEGKVDGKDTKELDKVVKEKKGIFSFLKRDKKKERVENDKEDVKKVVSKEEFLEDFKDGEKKGKKDPKKTVKKVEKEKSVEEKPKEKPKGKKSNTIEVTLT